MRMMDELKHLFLYSANKLVYAPIDEKDKRKNSAILLLSPNLEVSSRMMKLPYIYNPNIFNSFYIDRNVMAYIDNIGEENIEFDENEEEALSEAMVSSLFGKTKFKFDDSTSIMDRRYVEEIYNSKTVSKYTKTLGIKHIPDIINIVVHPNVRDLQKDVPKQLMALYENKLYSYTTNNEIHVISKLVYSDKDMGGSYDTYLLNELLVCLMTSYNDDLHFMIVKSIANVVSGQFGSDYAPFNPKAIDGMSKNINVIVSKGDYNTLAQYLKRADINILRKYIMSTALSDVRKLIFEASLSYFERQRLLPSDFGIPEKRKYPMPDEEHVLQAIKMFNNCDPSDEEDLAEDIIRRIKRFGITDVKVGASNRFRKYFNPKTQKARDKKENLTESFVNSDYEDILKICSHLSSNEFKRISFYDVYRDSQFVIKRIIHRIGLEPVGFLDVYHFPSKPDIAQITLAVDDRYRGNGIAGKMVRELMESGLENTFNFNKYIWTVHEDNAASIYLAEKNGFTNTNNIDSYGRMVFVKHVKEDIKAWSMIPDDIKPSSDQSFVETDLSFVTESMALLTESDESKYSQRLKKFLYSERIKNNKSVLELYDKVKETNPEIRRMYLKLAMYKKFNVFVDLSYYHALFLKNNIYKLDKAVDFYFNFLNRLINNPEINSEYKKRTIFIPVDSDVWPVQPMTELTDYRRNLNPISILFRLIRTNLSALKKAWGNQHIVFVGSRGYFTIDFNKLEVKDLSRIKINLRKLMSVDETIDDDFEVDEYEDNDTSKARANKMIDKIESKSGIKIDDVSSEKMVKNKPLNKNGILDSHTHLNIVNVDLSIDKGLIKKSNGIAILTIDPEGPEGFNKLDKSLLSNAASIDTYCLPEDK